MLRARYRDSYTQPGLMQAGQVYTLKPTPITTSIRFDKGHRIRVEVTSSNFPKFARNPNTGGPNETQSEAVVADNAVHRSEEHTSELQSLMRLSSDVLHLNTKRTSTDNPTELN